jgi:hypothetical protein
MARLSIEIKKMTEEQAKELLEKIVNKLDELDGEDFFGTEGWKHHFGLED